MKTPKVNLPLIFLSQVRSSAWQDYSSPRNSHRLEFVISLDICFVHSAIMHGFYYHWQTLVFNQATDIETVSCYRISLLLRVEHTRLLLDINLGRHSSMPNLQIENMDCIDRLTWLA